MNKPRSLLRPTSRGIRTASIVNCSVLARFRVRSRLVHMRLNPSHAEITSRDISKINIIETCRLVMDSTIPSVEMRFTSEEEQIDNLAINILKLYPTQASPHYGCLCLHHQNMLTNET